MTFSWSIRRFNTTFYCINFQLESQFLQARKFLHYGHRTNIILIKIVEMLSGYISGSGKFFIPLIPGIEDELKKINVDIEIKTLNTNTNLDPKDWVWFILK